MKYLKKYSIQCCLTAVLLSFAACSDSFMQQDPIMELAEGAFLKNEGDLPLYLNQLYDLYAIGHGRGNAYDFQPPYYITRGSSLMYGDIYTDNAVGFSNSTGALVNRLTGTWNVPAAESTSLSSADRTGWLWTNLRKVNYFLNHYLDAEGSVSNPVQLDKWKAEALFFKAWDYYMKMIAFGEVPWYETDLNVNSPDLYASRTPRDELAQNVLECLNFAVEHVQDGGTSHGRINRGMANFLKARFCLFEGTFRKYHGIGDEATYKNYLKEAETACEAIIASGNYSLYKPAGVKDPYWKLFSLDNTPDADGNKEAILARVYDGTTSLGHGTARYNIMNRGNASGRYSKGVTKSLVDEYLCADGKPIESSSVFLGYDGLWSELENRDPRLTQTVNRPGEYITIFNREAETMDSIANGIKYPEITYDCPTANQCPVGGPSVTGYQIVKHFTPAFVNNGSTTSGKQTAVIFRYGEVLLMLAESKAELYGTLSAADADRTIGELRRRVGFNVPFDPTITDVRLDAVWAAAGINITPLIREIRRERRVEMAMEGQRREDLVRWKAGKMIETPSRGMKFTAEKQRRYGGGKLAALPVATDSDYGTRYWYATQATLNSNVFVDADGFIIAYPKSANVTDGVVTWDDKYYFNPIPLQELTLNENLTQSPGWQGVR